MTAGIIVCCRIIATVSSTGILPVGQTGVSPVSSQRQWTGKMPVPRHATAMRWRSR